MDLEYGIHTLQRTREPRARRQVTKAANLIFIEPIGGAGAAVKKTPISWV